MRLHEWYLQPDGSVGRPEGEAGAIWDGMDATGAVVVGRRTAEQVDYYGGEHHGVPLFVVSHDPPSVPYEQVHFARDIETAMAQAKEAAGEKDVLVHGAITARTALEAGVLDELQLSQVHTDDRRGRRRTRPRLSQSSEM
ncbi:dihydrofolate reductase [Kribbella aluminosa]|uniref:Dihydrofolate reductase n=1 Tax=Kribbella aluminosa TaxID=416017 RepID=A0ABS4UZM5_9ACTN|nr:hypothetical protein [Kribbella aluminosa]MBP2357106.1 dihydrofolate reductase [Kribbella aluminosa]